MAKERFTNAEIALQYAKHGWKVYPLVQNKKFPYKGSKGHLDATNDPDEVIDLFFKYGELSNVGLNLLGTDIVVIDIDLHHEDKSGFEALKEIEDAYGELPSTYTVSTPRQGEHRYYRLPGLSMNKDIQAFRPGIDIMVSKIYVPPSQVTDDNGELIGKYAVKEGKITEIANLPNWFIKLLVQHEESTKTRMQLPSKIYPKSRLNEKNWKGMLLEEIVDGSVEGNRNAWITSMFGKLLYSRMDTRKAIQLIEVINQNFVSPPIKQKELEGIIKSVLSRDCQKLRGGMNLNE